MEFAMVSQAGIPSSFILPFKTKEQQRDQIPRNKLEWDSQKERGIILKNKRAKFHNQKESNMLLYWSTGAQTGNAHREDFLELDGSRWLWPHGWINEIQVHSLISVGARALKARTKTNKKQALLLLGICEVSSLLCNISSWLDILFNSVFKSGRANYDTKPLKQWTKNRHFVHLIWHFKTFCHSYAKLTMSIGNNIQK